MTRPKARFLVRVPHDGVWMYLMNFDDAVACWHPEEWNAASFRSHEAAFDWVASRYREFVIHERPVH